jgi:hypothetical protein
LDVVSIPVNARSSLKTQAPQQQGVRRVMAAFIEDDDEA